MLETGAVYILGVTGMIGLILCARKMEVIFRMIVRGCLGVVLLYGANLLIQYMETDVLVGLNLLTISCSALLGVPGVIMLYAVAALLGG